VTIHLKDLDIRSATREERDWTAELMAGSEPWITLGTTVEQCLRVCRDPEYLIFVGHHDGIPIGSIILHPRGLAGSPYIKSVAVAETQRSNGVGTQLIAFAENHFRNNSKHIFLCVSSFNRRAQAFYDRLGYTRVGEFNDYIKEGASEILFHKPLR